MKAQLSTLKLLIWFCRATRLEIGYIFSTHAHNTLRGANVFVIGFRSRCVKLGRADRTRFIAITLLTRVSTSQQTAELALLKSLSETAFLIVIDSRCRVVGCFLQDFGASSRLGYRVLLVAAVITAVVLLLSSCVVELLLTNGCLFLREQ